MGDRTMLIACTKSIACKIAAEECMRSTLKWIVPLLLIVILLGVYFWPIPRVPFDQVYSKVDSAEVASLQVFRLEHPVKNMEVNGVTWEYVSYGKGEPT